MLSVTFSRKADKFIDKAEKDLAKRLINAIRNLQLDPFPKGVKRVVNQWFENEKVFRIRVGDYRLLYTLNYQKNRLFIINIDKRPRVY